MYICIYLNNKYIYIYIYGAFRRPLSACFLDEEHLANLESEMKRHCGQSKDKDETMFTPEKTKGPIKDHGHNENLRQTK